MSAKLQNVEMRVVPDEDPDTSYLEQDEFADRLAQYNHGAFGFVGVRAIATVLLDTSQAAIVTIESPGIWGIEDDSGEDYFRSVYEDELVILREMLNELRVT